MDNYERENRIAEALEIRGIKQVELCEKAGVSRSALSHWIKQRWQPKQKPLMAMARALDVSELWLAGFDVEMKRPAEQVKADEIAKLVHRLRKDERLRNLVLSICTLKTDQLSIVENIAAELNKINSLPE